MTRFSQMVNDCRGAAVAQYGLIAAVAGVVIAVATLALGTVIPGKLATSAPATACVESSC